MARAIARVLWFQTQRVFVNSLRRALGNPVRAVLTLIIVGFIVCGWGAALLGSLMGASSRTPQPPFQPEQIFTRALGIVVLIHWVYVVSVIIPSVFRPAQILIQESDVHYLFTTPLKPLSLFRGIVLVRGLLGALFFLLLLVLYLVMFGGGNYRMLAQVQSPQASVWALLLYPLLYLMVFATALLGSVALEAMEIAGRSWRKLWAWGLMGWAAASVLLVGGRVWWLQAIDPNPEPLTIAIGQAVDWMPAYLLLLPVRALADAAFVLYNGFTPAMAFGLAFWLVGALLGNAMLVRYQDRLYEVGASLARKGAYARAAQSDPLRVYLQRKAETATKRPLRTPRWLQHWTPRGIWALLWRDLMISWRASGWGNLILIAIIAAIPILFMLLLKLGANPERNPTAALRVVYAISQAMVVFFLAFGAYYSMTDMLRRVDWQKPLPLAPHAVVIVEALPTVVYFALAQALTVILATTLFPHDWLFWLGGSVVATSWALALQMGMLWIALVNPDPSDYTQRLLTGVLMVPVLLLSGAPGLTIWIVGVAFKWPLLLSVGLAFVANLGVCAILVAINGLLYERFSPAE